MKLTLKKNFYSSLLYLLKNSNSNLSLNKSLLQVRLGELLIKQSFYFEFLLKQNTTKKASIIKFLTQTVDLSLCFILKAAVSYVYFICSNCYAIIISIKM